VSKRRHSTIAYFVYGGSLLFHAVLALGTVLMPKPQTSVATAITLVEEKKKQEPPKPPPPPPPPPKPEEKPKPKPAATAQAQQAKVAPEAKTEAPPPMPVDNGGFADLGVAMGNSDGPGLAVPGPVAAAATAAAAKGPAAAAATTHKVQQLEAPTQGAAACTDPVVRPKRKVPVAPKYTMQARQAEIEGVVRVQVTVDETGHVINARVISGLGYGLDESALTAAKATIFEPATQCGKAVVGTTILPFRFEET
jgi:protein TonB